MAWLGRRARYAAAAAAAAALVTVAVPAAATDKAACVSAAESGQRLKKARKLLASREQLLLCSSPDCPSIVSSDCTSWLGEVQRNLASLIVVARDGRGRTVADAQVTLDGSPVAGLGTPSPVEVDPGDHVVRCERTGAQPIEVRLSLADGERNHSVTCDLPSSADTAPPPGLTSPAPPEPPHRPIPWTSWVLGGVGVAGLATAGVFGGLELLQQKSDAGPGGCKPYCGGAEQNSIQTKIDVAYVALGVGAVALGAAVVLWLIQPEPSRAAWLVQLPQVRPASPW
jgi:hypothetical protein